MSCALCSQGRVQRGDTQACPQWSGSETSGGLPGVGGAGAHPPSPAYFSTAGSLQSPYHGHTAPGQEGRAQAFTDPVLRSG